MSAGQARPLEADNLAKTYRHRTWTGSARDTEALKGVDFAVARGETFGLVGPNGSGKSTTLKLALGLIRPTRGKIRLNGYPGDDARGRADLGFMPENPGLVPHLTPCELLAGAARSRGRNWRAARSEANDLLEHLGLVKAARQPLSQHSKGMAQRVALGFALAGEPRFLILDEPLTGLDPLWRHRVSELLANFRAGGGTIVFSSHILSDVERLADRVAIFQGGHIVREARPSDLLAEKLTGYSIRYRGEEPLPGWDSMAEGPGLWRLPVASGDLWSALDTLRDTGREVMGVEPRGAGLEEIFLATTEEPASP